jgi:hypothetical protein
MCRIVSQLLESAELDTFVIDASDRADLHSVCSDVAEFVAPLALSSNRKFTLHFLNETLPS